MRTEKVKGTNWLWWKAGKLVLRNTWQHVGRVTMCFVRPWGRYKEVESDVETEMNLIKGPRELICLPI